MTNFSSLTTTLTASLAASSLLLGSSTAFVAVPTAPQHFAAVTQLEAMSFNNEPSSSSIVGSSKLPGNLGFDPLHFCHSRQQLVQYRQAEMKHARVAMLAVLAIVWSDLNVIDTIGATPLVEGRVFPEFLGACVGLPAALELYGEKIDEEHAKYINTSDEAEAEHLCDDGYFIGNLELDPFHLYPAETNGQRRVQFAEIMTGRICMMAAAFRLTENAMEYMGVDDAYLLSLLPTLPESVTQAVEQIIV